MRGKKGKFYRTYYVSPDLLKRGRPTAPNRQPRWVASQTAKPSQSIHKGFNSFAIKQEYAKNDLRYFSTKRDFMNYLAKTALSAETKEAYWKQYLERDVLLAKGVYGSIRDREYQEKYLGKLKEHIDDPNAKKLYNALRKLPTERFGDLLASDALPDMTRYYVASNDEVFTSYGEGSFETIESRLRKQGIDINKYQYSGLRGINDLDESEAMERIEYGLEGHALNVRISKRGKAYIPFVPKRYQDRALEYFFDMDENRDY